jgi:hypothetical protein
MAQKTVIQLIDDLDGSEAQGTVSFGLDGTATRLSYPKCTRLSFGRPWPRTWRQLDASDVSLVDGPAFVQSQPPRQLAQLGPTGNRSPQSGNGRDARDTRSRIEAAFLAQ